MIVPEPKRYEHEFNSFYKKEWKHNRNVSEDELLLTAYPHTVDIDLAPGDVWLELGVGSGRVVDFHKKKLLESTCIGVDYSMEALRQLKSTLPVEIDVLVADIRNLPFKTAAFDLITLFGTIQAYPKEQWFTGIDRLIPFLKPRGRLGFSVHPLSALELIRCLRAPKDLKNIITERTLQRLLKNHGYIGRFQIERHRVFSLLQKITDIFRVEFLDWYGFHEFRNTTANRRLTLLFDKILPSFTFGHYWIWIWTED
jgi:ubiquinone/menaquinone biosynthesis C-methylase UbiE